MTSADMLHILQAWQTTIQHAEADIERVVGPLKCAPESALYDVPWRLMQAYTEAISARIGDHADWLGWYRADNDMGARKMEAGYSGKRRKIKTLRDLARVIVETRE